MSAKHLAGNDRRAARRYAVVDDDHRLARDRNGLAISAVKMGSPLELRALAGDDLLKLLLADPDGLELVLAQESSPAFADRADPILGLHRRAELADDDYVKRRAERCGHFVCDGDAAPGKSDDDWIIGPQSVERRSQLAPGVAPVGEWGEAFRHRLSVESRRVSASISAEELRSAQQPLKERYRDDPESAQITLHADGELGEGVTCSVQTGRALVEAGLHPGTGGDGLSACSGDMLLQALAACAGVTMRAVATSMGITVRGGVHAEGDLDWRGTLSVDRQAPVGFKEIRVRFDLVSDAGDEELETLLRLTERFCVVYQTLAGSPGLSVTLERGAG